MDTIKLNEEAVRYLDSLDPAERDEYYRQLEERRNRPPEESLESLTERLSRMNPREHRKEMIEVKAQIDKKLKVKAQTQLALFINAQIEQGGTINTKAIQAKAKNLGLETYGDVTEQINEVMEVRRHFQGDE